MKDYRYLYTLLIFLTSISVKASPLLERYLALTGPEQTLLVINQSAETQYFWLSLPVMQAQAMSEERFELQAGEKRKLSLKDWQSAPWVRLAASSAQLRFESGGSEIFVGSSNHVALKKGIGQGTLWLSNLTGQPQAFSLQGRRSKRLLEPFETREIKWNDSASSIVIHADLRITASFKNDLNHKKTHAVPQKSSFNKTLRTSISKFVVANSSLTESFVIEIEDPELISKAREQIHHPEKFLQRMLIAEVSPGADQLNFDVLNPLQAPWSWHVSKVHRFADFGSIDCDGSPQQMEVLLNWWIPARGGGICFWDYKIKAELK